jgi:hypothetical protein
MPANIERPKTNSTPAFSRASTNRDRTALITESKEMDSSPVDWVVHIHHRIFGRVHVVRIAQVPPDCPESPHAYFGAPEEKIETSHPQPDFCPFNLLTIHDFCKLVDQQVLQNSHRSTALCAGDSFSSQCKAAYLLGAYMIIRMQSSPDDAMDRLLPVLEIGESPVPGEECRSIKGHLDIRHCLEGLWKAAELGWIDFSEDGFDPHEYAHFDSPLNADLHEIVPRKLLTMRVPRVLATACGWEDRFVDGRFSHREFSPAYYAELLEQFDARVCLRLGTPYYGREALEGTGLTLQDLYCEDYEIPPPNVVERFLAVVEAAPGPVAVQSQVGLGLAGTLIALYMMKHHGFEGLQAAAWIRIVRPRRCAARLPEAAASRLRPPFFSLMFFSR